MFVKARMNTTHASISGSKTLPTHAKESYMPRIKFPNVNASVAKRPKAKGKRPQTRHAYMYTRRHIPMTDFRIKNSMVVIVLDI